MRDNILALVGRLDLLTVKLPRVLDLLLTPLDQLLLLLQDLLGPNVLLVYLVPDLLLLLLLLLNLLQQLVQLQLQVPVFSFADVYYLLLLLYLLAERFVLLDLN